MTRVTMRPSPTHARTAGLLLTTAVDAALLRATGPAAAAAVGRVGLGVGLAAIGRVLVAVAEPAVARGGGAHAVLAHDGGGIGERSAHHAALAAVPGVGLRGHLAAVGEVAVAVGEALHATDGALALG